MPQNDDWQETLADRKHKREQVTARIAIVTIGIAGILFSGLVVHCMENSPPDTTPQHGNPCSVGVVQPGETVTCPDFAKTPTP